MTKKRKIFKRVLSICLVLLLCANSFAAIVADNDGSAFVTKSEFEALKADFAKQVQNYNESIEGKIDGSIASYLAGLRISEAPVNTWSRVIETTGGKLRFMNTVSGKNGSNSNTMGLSTNLIRYYRKKQRALYLYVAARGSDLAGMDILLGASNCTWDTARWRKVAEGTNKSWSVGSGWGQNSSGTLPGTEFKDGSATKFSETKGSGAGWIYRKSPDGTLSLLNYDTVVYPKLSLFLNGFTYQDLSGSDWTTMNKMTTANGHNSTTTLSIDIPSNGQGYGSYKKNDSITPSSATNASHVWATYQINKVEANDGIDYSVRQWGRNTATSVYCYQDTLPLTDGSKTTVAATAVTYEEPYYPHTGMTTRNVSLSGVGYTYYPKKLIPESKTLNSFANEYLSTVAGETVYLGNGAPLVETRGTEQTVECKLTFKLRTSADALTSGNITYIISDAKFTNGSVSTGAKSLATGTVSIGSTGTTITADISCDKQQTYWINCYAATEGNIVELSDAQFKLK